MSSVNHHSLSWETVVPMRVLIMRGARFIGSHLTDLLLTNRHRVRIPDNLTPQAHWGRQVFRPLKQIDGRTIAKALPDAASAVQPVPQ
jgi:nucleoside-diphosphate-sugar epimerase